jgi:hypothetical protein
MLGWLQALLEKGETVEQRKPALSRYQRRPMSMSHGGR